MWTITEKELVSEDGSDYISYGISSEDCIVDDITSEYAVITRFADQLNRYGASSLHIMDIIENFFAEL